MAQNQSLSTQEVADILHVCKSTIYDLIRKGEIHSYKSGERFVLRRRMWMPILPAPGMSIPLPRCSASISTPRC